MHGVLACFFVLCCVANYWLTIRRVVIGGCEYRNWWAFLDVVVYPLLIVWVFST